MSQSIANPHEIRHTQTTPSSPLRKVLQRSRQTAPELSVTRPEASRAVTFEPFAIPKQRGLLWGIATPTETPLRSGGQYISSIEKPLPGLPMQRAQVPSKRISATRDHNAPLRVLPRAKSELHLERTMRANSHQSLPELSTIIEEDRPSITSSRTTPNQTAVICHKAYPPIIEQAAVQADPLAFMPILVPTKAPLRGWSPEDLDCPGMTSSNNSLASSRTTSVVTTPLPKWETESAYPFPLVRIANADDGHAIVDDEASALNDFSIRSVRMRPEANKKGAAQHHPAIEEMLVELADAQSQWFGPERRNPSHPQRHNNGRLAAERISEDMEKPWSATVLPGHATTRSSVSDETRSAPETSSRDGRRSSGTRIPVPKLSVLQSVAPPAFIATAVLPADRAANTIKQGGSIIKKRQAAAADLFEYADLKDNNASFETGRMEAERIAKEFWTKYKATKSGVQENLPVKVMLESLFYSAPADLRPCPERLRFLGIRR